MYISSDGIHVQSDVARVLIRLLEIADSLGDFTFSGREAAVFWEGDADDEGVRGGLAAAARGKGAGESERAGGGEALQGFREQPRQLCEPS